MTDQGYRVQIFCPHSCSLKGKATEGNRRQHIPTQKSHTQPGPLGLDRGPGSLHTLKSSKLRKKWRAGKTKKQRKTAFYSLTRKSITLILSSLQIPPQPQLRQKELSKPS